MASRPEFDANRISAIAALCLLGSVTPSAVLLGPLIVGGLVTELGFRPQIAGNMIFAELCGAASATFLAFCWIRHGHWRRVLWLSLTAIVACDAASAFLVQPWTLGAVRFIAGVGVGTVMCATLLTSGMTRNQERVLSFWMMGQIIFAAVALAVMPYLFARIGLRGFYACLAAVMAVLLVAVRFMPPGGGEVSHMRWSELPDSTRRRALAGLLGLLFFFIAVGGVWTFFERIGDSAGFSRGFISLTLSVVSAVGVLGAISAALLGLKWGRMTPFAIGIGSLVVSMMLLYRPASPAVFIIAAFLFKFGWWFVSPYILANMTTLDPSGKLIAATGFVIPFGQALGPLVVGMLLLDSASKVDFTPAMHVGLACLALCCALFISVIRENDASGITSHSR